MNLTLAALLGLSLGQAPAADYYPLNSRNIKLPIQYQKDRKLIRQVQLFVSEDQGNTWHQKSEAPPDRDAFTYSAPKDGLYWFHIVTVDLKGVRDPANLTTEPPAQKALVDTTPPQVRFTNARRAGNDVVVEWVIDDQYPDDTKTKVFFRPAGSEGYWQEVTVHPSSRNGVQFPASTTAPVVVKVTAHDLAGNKNEGVREIPAAGSNTQVTASLSPAGTAAPPAAPVQPAGHGSVPPPADLTGGGPVAPPGGPVAPPPPPPMNLTPQPAPPTIAAGPAAPQTPIAAPPTSPVVAVTPPAMQPNPVVMQPAPVPSGPPPVAVFQGTPSPTYTPPPAPPAQPAEHTTPVTTAAQTHAPATNPAAVAVFHGPATTTPTVELSRIQAINHPRFDMAYQVEHGPSGVSRVDLWVTRDDGQTWKRWSQHDGRAGAIRVTLDTPDNAAVEGLYGFRLVPVSGAGLSDREPTRGDAPEWRLVVDTTTPRIEWYPPTADAHDTAVLVMQWRATDANFADDPITLEWSEKPTGPWVSLAGGSGEVVQANATGGPAVQRLPNTGRYAWRVPTGLPPRVYIRITARDAAGNVQTGVIGPTLIDLTKPRARISGLASQPTPTPRPQQP